MCTTPYIPNTVYPTKIGLSPSFQISSLQILFLSMDPFSECSIVVILDVDELQHRKTKTLKPVQISPTSRDIRPLIRQNPGAKGAQKLPHHWPPLISKFLYAAFVSKSCNENTTSPPPFVESRRECRNDS